GRSYELHALAGPDHLPSTFVDKSVVVVAQGNQVREIAPATSRPELDVMRVGHVHRPVAFRGRTGAVSCLKRSPLRWRDAARCSANVNDDRVSLENPVQGSVAGQALDGLARDRHSALQL